ncbi:MAG TPA: MFS transporter [Stellaceae bacterium]|nr:MFS transporter [Stellaceae bacterium]
MEFDVAEIIDRHHFGAFQLRIVILCALVQFFEGFDALMLAYTAPALSKTWHIAHRDLGPVFAASLAGMSIGTVVLSPLADWFGRKRLLIISVLLFGGLTLVASQAQDVRQLSMLRFVIGFGLAAAVPSTFVLVNEFAPRRYRATMVMCMAIGVAVGAATGGQLAALLVPSIGWRGMFVIGGVAPLVLLPFLLAWLPESVRFLIVKGGRTDQVIATLKRLDPSASYPPNARFNLHHRPQPKGIRVGELFTQGRLPVTACLWLAFVLSLIVLNFMNNWLPSVLATTGLPQAQALRIGTLFQIGGMIGIPIMGFLSDRFGYFRVLGATLVLQAFFVALIGWSEGSVPLLVVAVPMVGCCVIGVNNALMALAVTLYPTAIRATGSSWAHGFGRFGGIFGPIIGGILLSQHWSLQQVFAVGALFPLCNLLVVMTMAWCHARAQLHAPVEPEMAQPLQYKGHG